MPVVSINDVYNLAYSVASKQGYGFPSPKDFNAYANLANIDLYNYYNDELNKQLLRVKNGETIYMPEVLTNFIVNALPLTFVGNSASLPNNYVSAIAMTLAPASGKIDRIDPSKLPDRLKSTFDAPTAANPIYVETPDDMQTYPTIPTAYLTYYQAPPPVLWNYSMATGRPVYTSVGSIDFTWDSTELLRLTSRVLQLMGLSIRDTELTQYANQMIKEAS